MVIVALTAFLRLSGHVNDNEVAAGPDRGDLPVAAVPAASEMAEPPGDHDGCYMFGHLCVFDVEGAFEGAGDGDPVDDGDECVAVVDVAGLGVAELCVAALATPTAPAPRPPASAAVTDQAPEPGARNGCHKFLLPCQAVRVLATRASPRMEGEPGGKPWSCSPDPLS